MESFGGVKNGTTDMGDFLLSTATYSVSGYVTDVFGRSIKGAKVSLNSPGQGIERDFITTGEDGKFVFDDLFKAKIEISSGTREMGYKRIRPPVGTSGNRITLTGKIPEENVGIGLVPSAAVQLTFVDKGTQKPINLPKAFVFVTLEDGSMFKVGIDEEGRCRLMLGAGKYEFSLNGTDGKYRWRKKEFVAELYEVYELTCEPFRLK
jgi:hypothetical protein